MSNAPSSVSVQADAQFTVAKVLRPFKNFAASYQGQDATIPIAMPGDLDPDAGKPGFSPYLLRGTPVPFGGKMTLWLPMLTASIGENDTSNYVYLLHWRLRSVVDFVRRMQQTGEPVPYHLKKAGDGALDTLLAPTPSPERVVLPSATETVLYQQAEPAGVSPGTTVPGVGVANLRTEQIAVPGDGVADLVTAGLPLLPPGAPPFASAYPGGSTTPLGVFQQGVLDPSDSLVAGYSIYRPYFTVAKGDELMITVVRDPSAGSVSPNVWDFTEGGVDGEFGLFYSQSEDVGIFLFSGSNPS